MSACAPLPDDDTEEVKPVAAESEDDGFEAEPDEAKEIDQVADEIVIADDDDENPASRMTNSASTSPKTRTISRKTPTTCRSWRTTTAMTISVSSTAFPKRARTTTKLGPRKLEKALDRAFASH